MRKLNLIIAVVSTFLMLTIISCKKCKPISCDGVFCTLEFRTISVEVISNGFNPIPVQKVVTKASNGTIINTSTQPQIDSTNLFNLATDNSISTNTQQQVTFEVYKQGMVVGSKTFTIGKDCCHIYCNDADKSIIVP